MYVKAKCKTCGEEGFLNLGDAITTMDEAKQFLANYKGSQCPFRNHFEISGVKFELVSEATLEELQEMGVVTTDEAFIAKLKANGDDVFTTDELYTLDLKVDGFGGGAMIGHIESTGEKVVLEFTQTPSGKRVYFIESGKLQPKAAVAAEG